MSVKEINAWKKWLCKQTKRDDAVGDFARDFLMDDTPGLTTLSAIDLHIKQVSDISDRVLAARDRAWREYAETLTP